MVVAQSIGGENVSETVEGRERYPINVRYAREFRDDPGAPRAHSRSARRDGAQVPLSQVASIHSVLGPPMIRSEGGKLVGFVFVDTDRPIADYVAEAKQAVARDVQLPPGTRLEWVGQFKYFERAKERLKWVIPLTLGIVFVLLYFNTQSLVETLHRHARGAVLARRRDLAALSAALQHQRRGLGRRHRARGPRRGDRRRDAALPHARLRPARARRAARDRATTCARPSSKARRSGSGPKLMTVATMIIGLVPVLWSTGTGADVMKRIAAPMVGGLVTSFLLELTVYPAIFAIWKGRGLDAEHPVASIDPP